MWIAYWDIVTTIALIFTSTVTPLEVAFLQPLAPDERWTNGLFLTNRAVDCVFIFDMVRINLSCTARPKRPALLNVLLLFTLVLLLLTPVLHARSFCNLESQ